MKNLHYIFYFFVAVVFVFTASCSSGSGYMKEAMESAEAVEYYPEVVENLEYEFESDIISEYGLNAFEHRAIQKVNDFVDLISLIADDSMDREFVEQAKGMLYSLFKENSCVIVLSTTSDKGKKISLNNFVNAIEQLDVPDFKIDIKNIERNRPLTAGSVGNYEGTLKCTMNISAKLSLLNGFIPEQDHNVEIRMHILKVNKSFGDTDKELWEVMLGDIFLLAD